MGQKKAKGDSACTSRRTTAACCTWRSLVPTRPGRIDHLENATVSRVLQVVPEKTVYDGVGLNSTDADGNLPLHLACAYGTPEDVNWIWQQLNDWPASDAASDASRVTFKEQLKATNKQGMWPAACAVAAGNTDMVDWLTSPHMFGLLNEIEVEEGLTRALLGLTVNDGIWRLNDHIPSLVHVACIEGKTDIYDLLVKEKPESKKWAALHPIFLLAHTYPAHCASSDMIGHLEEGGAFSVQDDEYGATRMHWAAFHGEKNIVQQLKDMWPPSWGKAGGHDPKDNAGRTPLDYLNLRLGLGEKLDTFKGEARFHGFDFKLDEQTQKDLEKLKAWLEDENPPQPYIELGMHGNKNTAKVYTEHLSLGMLVVGMPGSGKTFGMKKVVEELAMLTSMRHVVIFDVKGDWSQLLVPKDESDKKNEKFTENCDVRVYTFGTGCGFPATLDPFVGEKLEIDGYDFDTTSWASRDHQTRAEENVRVLVKDTLTAVGLIKTDLEKGVELANTMLPALANASGYHASGARDASDKQALATDLISVGWQTCLRIYYENEALPKTFEEFAKGLKQLLRKPTRARRLRLMRSGGRRSKGERGVKAAKAAEASGGGVEGGRRFGRREDGSQRGAKVAVKEATAKAAAAAKAAAGQKPATAVHVPPVDSPTTPLRCEADRPTCTGRGASSTRRRPASSDLRCRCT